ncbi:MAG TPA: DUF202 domain-containing protein [Saprospiraceae bacterium]|nr:DUF202 domain-containing protein [Saprospiraceae bacterium]
MDIENKNKDLILRENLALQRTILANQSTFLSFLRTSMYFLVAGLSVHNLLDMKSSITISYVFYGISFALLVFGVVNYILNDKKIKENRIHVGGYKTEYLNS